MPDAFRHQQFTRVLAQFSERLDGLLLEMRRFEQPGLIPAEVLDELASTLGELMLVLVGHKNSNGGSGYAGRTASDARHLREVLRLGAPPTKPITDAIHTLLEELSTLIHEEAA